MTEKGAPPAALEPSNQGAPKDMAQWVRPSKRAQELTRAAAAKKEAATEHEALREKGRQAAQALSRPTAAGNLSREARQESDAQREARGSRAMDTMRRWMSTQAGYREWYRVLEQLPVAASSYEGRAPTNVRIREALHRLPAERHRLVDVLEHWAYHPDHTLAPEMLNNVAQAMLRRETSALPWNSGRALGAVDPSGVLDIIRTHGRQMLVTEAHTEAHAPQWTPILRAALAQRPRQQTLEEQQQGAAARQLCSVEHLASLAVLMRGASESASDRAWLRSILRELAAMTRTLANASTRATQEQLAAWSDATRTIEYLDMAGEMRNYMDRSAQQRHGSQDRSLQRARQGQPSQSSSSSKRTTEDNSAREPTPERGSPRRDSRKSRSPKRDAARDRSPPRRRDRSPRHRSPKRDSPQRRSHSAGVDLKKVFDDAQRRSTSAPRREASHGSQRQSARGELPTPMQAQPTQRRDAPPPTPPAPAAPAPRPLPTPPAPAVPAPFPTPAPPAPGAEDQYPTAHPPLDPQTQWQLQLRQEAQGREGGSTRTRMMAITPERLGPPAVRVDSQGVPFFEALNLTVPSFLLEHVASRLPGRNIESMAQLAMGRDPQAHGTPLGSVALASNWLGDTGITLHMERAGVPMVRLVEVVALTQELLQYHMAEHLDRMLPLLQVASRGDLFAESMRTGGSTQWWRIRQGA